MSKDIGVDLFELCNKEFKKKLASDTQLKQLLKRVNSENATYSDANAFSIRVGELLSNVFKENINKDVLPDGKMYYNIAKRVVDPLMKQDHACVSKACSIVQKTMNKNARNGLNALDPTVNQDRIDGIVDVVSGYDDYDDAKYMLDEPMVNFSQSVVDDAIKTNADFQFKSGMSPKIVRTSTGHCCDWCMNLVGVYNYEDVRDTGNDVFRRHKYCRCNVDYIPSEGKRQNVHSRQWYKYDLDNNYLQQSAVKDNGINNVYTVNYELINSKKFHDKFEQLPVNKNLREQLYSSSMEILEKQNGTGNESIFVLDSRTGKELRKMHGSDKLKGKISMDGLEGEKITILHNHPCGGRFSYIDIKSYFERDNIENAVVVGNNGEVHIISDFDRKFNIEKFYDLIYDNFKVKYNHKDMAKKKALDAIYGKEVFKYEKK